MKATELIRMLWRTLRELLRRWTVRLVSAAHRILGRPARHDEPGEPPGPPMHWLRHTQRESPLHWVEHIDKSAPHLLSAGHLNVPQASTPSPPKARPRTAGEFRKRVLSAAASEEPRSEALPRDGHEGPPVHPHRARRAFAPALTDPGGGDEPPRQASVASVSRHWPELPPLPGLGDAGRALAADSLASQLWSEARLTVAVEADRWPTLAPNPLGSGSLHLEAHLRRYNHQIRLEHEQEGLLWSE